MSGEIVKVGEAIKNFKAGDKVVAMINPAVWFLAIDLLYSPLYL